MPRAIIVSNGKINDYSYYKDKIKEDDYIICADGGIKHLLQMGVYPDLWLGDFDSCRFSELKNEHKELNNIETISLNTAKDETDTHYACITAIDRGYKDILIWGACGGRIDHMLSNIHLLEFLKNKNVKGVLEDEKNTLVLVSDEVNIIKKRKYLSILPMSETAVIEKTQGLLYPLENFSLRREVSMGVSNEIVSDKASIKLKSGLVLIAESDD